MEENHFDRLPDCLLIVIFNKILEAKTLIQCSLVSKRFASLIRHIDTLLLRVAFYRTSRLGRLMNFIPIFKFWRRTQNSCSLNHAPLTLVPNLLKNKFQEVKFMQIDLQDCRLNHIMKPCPLRFKYKAMFGSHFEFFVVLSGNLICETRHSVPATTATPTQEGLDVGLRTAQEYRLTLLKLAALWHCLYLTVVYNQETHHQSLVVVDNLGMGKVCMGEEQLARLRSCTTPFRYLEPNNEVVCSEKLWFVPVLNLPLSGYVMTEVSLAVVKPVDQPIVMERDVQVILGAFNEEEEGKVYDEAVIEILKDSNKKTCMREVLIN